jgi:Flp pilus assembly protein TadD
MAVPGLRRKAWLLLLAAAGGAGWLVRAQLGSADEARLWQHRNLGKAFYENPTTGPLAVEEFRKALALKPNSARERLNYGLALLRARDVKNGVAELEKVQRQDPRLPHTWFNLGIAYKNQNDFDRALAQFREMARLAPREPVCRYQLGVVLKLRDDAASAAQQFEAARDLNPRLAAPHFQLYNLYRLLDRPREAAAELEIFRRLKQQQEGAAMAEDMEWCAYAEIDDPTDAPIAPPPAPPVYREETLARGFGGGTPGVAVLDLEGSGRPSLLAWSANRVALFRNGKTKVADTGLEGLREVVFIAPGDFDNDGLADLCIVTSHAVVLYRNVNGRFRKHAELASGTFRKAVWLDFDHDYDQDLFLFGDDSRLLRNNGAAGFSDESRRFPFVAGRALDAVRFDSGPDTPGFDLLVSYAGRPGVLYRDRLGGSYEATAAPAVPVLPAVAADFEGRGRLDRARIAQDGRLSVDRDVTPDYGNWIEIALRGVKNPKLAWNARIEVKAGTLYRQAMYYGVPVVFRLGASARVDTVRITWPNALIQNEVNQAVNRVAAIREAPRLAGSCPMIFTWDGRGFKFVTDVLGVAPLGASAGDGVYFPVDHDEYVSIPGEMLKTREGRYDIRVTEELREVSYIDQIKLFALDHPAAIDIVTNEKFKSPPFPEFRLFGVERRIYPLVKRDRAYLASFRRNEAGVAEMHHLDLDFGNAARANRAVLVLHGWVDWADGSTFLAATQARQELVFPYLQVKDSAGNWKTVIEDMGMPSGKPKTMAVDLAGKFLSPSREVRIVTNLCVYWDEIFLVDSDAAPPVRLTAAPLASAELRFHGFSKATIHPQRKQPEMFDYQTAGPATMWNPTPGNYTRYGDVAALLADADDRMVIMGSGDEMRLSFAAGEFPPLPAGWKRDFLLLVDGWAKDADANTAFSQSVLPLPFHAMSRYPYPAGESYPQEAYMRTYLTRPALRLIRPLEKGTDAFIPRSASSATPLATARRSAARLPPAAP